LCAVKGALKGDFGNFDIFLKKVLTTPFCCYIINTTERRGGDTKMERTRMKEIRGERSQKTMAELLGLTQQHYCSIENGKRGIKPKYFKRFEAVFGEKIEKLAPDIFLPSKTSECCV
jgi:DNA-binding XRE family transcriptional regulator